MSYHPSELKISVVIPCYKVGEHLAKTVARIGPEVSRIYCVIDGCKNGSMEAAKWAQSQDRRVQILSHANNQGVGRAFITGYQEAAKDHADIIIKLDGDGQMNPEEIPRLIEPLVRGEADYVKGNRFFHLEHLQSMPIVRIFGNAALSFFSKLSSGYWNLFDPTNGFVAIHAKVAEHIPWSKVHNRYFFESDLLFHLYMIRAVVFDVPMQAQYGNETSGLSIIKTIFQFPCFHFINFVRRIFYCYFLREFNIASLNLIVSIVLIGFGVSFGTINWVRGNELNQLASAGTVMFAALPVILGWQALLAFLAYDVGNYPKKPLKQTFRA